MRSAKFSQQPRRGAWAWLVFGCALLFLVSATAFAKSWRIADFHSTITVNERGFTTVSERLNLVFVGEWHGIWRSIPVEYPGPRGSNYSLFLKVESVSDGDGNAL